MQAVQHSAANTMTKSLSRAPKKTGFWRCTLSLRCLVLVLVALQGPIPWCHCHGTLANSPDSFSWLGDHLRSHHVTVSPLANHFFGWHFHVDVSNSSGDNPDQPADQDRDRLPTTNSTDGLTVLLADNARSSPQAAVVDDRSHECAVAMLVGLQNTAHFFDSFAPTLPLPLRFCVLRS